MRITVFEDHEALSRAAAALIRERVARKPDLLLCAATGETPTRTYAHLAETPGPFADLRIVKLDEWGGLAMSDPATCEQYLRAHVLGPLGVRPDRYLGVRSDAEDAHAECGAMQVHLDAAGPIDICLLGLGLNGHLALNEPAAALEPDFHVARLAETSRKHPMLVQATGPVRYGLTLGMAGIMQARLALLLVSGARKRQPLRRLLERKVTPRFPASFLWLHPNAVCLCDDVAAKAMDLPRG